MVIGLLDAHVAQGAHVGVDAQPEDGRVGVHELDVDLLAGHQHHLLLLVLAALRVAHDVEAARRCRGVVLLHVQVVRERAVDLLHGDGERSRVLAVALLAHHVLLDLELQGALLAIERERAAEARQARAIHPQREQARRIDAREQAQRAQERLV